MSNFEVPNWNDLLYMHALDADIVLVVISDLYSLFKKKKGIKWTDLLLIGRFRHGV